ncbi:hypothetical protein Y032_0531g3013 [Ancylostoma ceylanicum]|nr:hypothetical protein Y032_0531g3013 [Ancylostoma ceylanicum]
MEEPVLGSNSEKVINGYAFLADTILLIGFGLIGGFLIPSITGTFHRGFFCNDQSIQYPYKNDTVTPTVLFLYSFLAMILTIIATEFYRAKKSTRVSTPYHRIGNTSIHFVVVKIITYIGYSLIGFMCVLVLTNITKSCVGRLRPHFLDVCKPINITCHSDEYYNNYTCSGDPVKVEEARKSFFSGHSSISMYASTFTALYLLFRMPCNSLGRVAVPIMQTAFLSTGLLISLSRINDNKHHWSDVIIGVFVGIFAAAYTCFVWAGMSNNNGEEVLPLHRPHVNYVDPSAAISNGTIMEYAISEQESMQTERRNQAPDKQ